MPEVNGNGVHDSTEENGMNEESRKRKPEDDAPEPDTPTKKPRPTETTEETTEKPVETTEKPVEPEVTDNVCVDLDASNTSAVEESRAEVSVEAARSEDDEDAEPRRRRFSGESDSDVVALDDDDEEEGEGDAPEDEEEDSEAEGQIPHRLGCSITRVRRKRPEVFDLSDEEEEGASGSSGTKDRPLVLADWPHAHQCVLVLRLRRPFYIVGNYEVKCVKGTVDIMGATLSPKDGFNDFVPVYSSRYYGGIPIEIKSATPENPEGTTKLQNEEFSCRSQDIVLVLRRLQDSLTQHVQNYAPNSLGLSKALVSAGESTYPHLNFINCVGLYEHQRTFFKECGLKLLDLDMDFLHTAVFGEDSPKDFSGIVLACGGKNTGKSTVLRCLVNTALSGKGKRPVLYLDCDPGQSEFCVSGTVSLVEVTKPLLGPAFTHNMRPVSSYFLGHTNIVSCPNEYLRAVAKLVELKNSKPEYADALVFVNTMGWTRGMGVDLLVEVIKLLKPKVVIQLQSKSDTHNLPTMSCDFVSKHESTLVKKKEDSKKGGEGKPDQADESGELPFDFQLIHFRSGAEADPHLRSIEGMRAAATRDLMTLAYFSQLQPGISQPAPLNSVVPYKIRWRSIAIQSNHSCIPAADVLNLVVGNLVALCQADPEDLVLPKDPSLPRLVKQDALPTCIGFGFVRAIDPKDKLIYVVTPMMPKRLKPVNCLSVGVVSMPQCLLDESPHYFSVSPGEILSPNRGDTFRPALQRGVVPRTFRKRQ